MRERPCGAGGLGVHALEVGVAPLATADVAPPEVGEEKDALAFDDGAARAGGAGGASMTAGARRAKKGDFAHIER